MSRSFHTDLWSYNRERSNAEDQATIYLHDKGLKFQCNVPAPLDLRPDMIFFNVKKPYRCLTVWIDGQPHDSNVQKGYDEAITLVLERNRIKVLRFKHTGSFSAKRLQEIFDEIKKYLI